DGRARVEVGVHVHVFVAVVPSDGAALLTRTPPFASGCRGRRHSDGRNVGSGGLGTGALAQGGREAFAGVKPWDGIRDHRRGGRRRGGRGARRNSSAASG